MISIVIPLYNKEKEIARTLRSALNQTFHDFEIVVINDGSTDNSVTELEKINDPRIRLFHQTNAGVSAARNRGIDEARWNLIAFLDADDEWKPEYLQTQYELFLKYPECSVFACNYEFQDSEGKRSPTIIRKLPFGEEDGILSNYFEVASYSHPPICSISIMVRKEAILSISGFLEGVTLGEDLITWAKLACHFKIAYSKKRMETYNIRTTKQLVTPRREPDRIDLVGNEFALLNRKNCSKSLKKYTAKWHKMRYVTYIRLGRKNDAFKELRKILNYTLPDAKLIYWIILNLCPQILTKLALHITASLKK